MELLKDIQINYRSGIADRIFISDGAEDVEYIDNVKTSKNTYIPKKPWRKINNEEQNVLICSSLKKDYSNISLLSLPINLVRELKKINFEKCINNNDVGFIQSSIEYKIVIENIVKHFEKINDKKGEFEVHNLFFGKPNLHNNTFDTKNSVYIGMHLDSWERKNFIERKYARNRICINLGAEPRHLLFYNISIHKMAELINLNNQAETMNINEIYKLFVAKNISYPILKLCINPFEAYLAPTEFIIHDGCNEGTTMPDINIVLRGYYNYNKTSLINNFLTKLKLKK